ncbi:MAG: lipid II flippase MurJ [Candidatus Paceibacterota bacterium]|jgi:putative peptidoglycan lipid II flippase
MVKKFFNLLGKEFVGLHEAAYLLAFFTLLSQILGLVRDRLLASTFGASAALDSYYAAFRIPDLIFVAIASIVSVSILVPFIIERLRRSETETREFLDAIFSFFAVLMVIVSASFFLLTPKLLTMIFPKIIAGQYSAELIMMTRWMLLSPILLGLSNLLASVTQAKHRFFSYAISPVFYNAGIIFGLLVFYPLFGLVGLALGVVLGAALHLIVQIISVGKLFPRFRLPFNFQIIKQVVALSFSRTLALSASQIALLALVAFAAYLAVGSVSVFNFSWNLQSVPLAIVGASYTVALFPTISRLFGAGEKEKFFQEMLTAARHITFWSVPIIILFIVLRAQIVRTVLGSGNFDWADTRLTAAALALFSISILSQSLILLFVRGYYAGGNTKKPLIINLFSAALIVILAFSFLWLFKRWEFFRYFTESLLRVDSVAGAEVLMLPLGFSVAQIINASIFWFYFARRFPTFSPIVSRTFFEIFSTSVIMGFVAYRALNVFDKIFNLETLLGVFLQGFFSGLMGIAVGVFVLVLLKNRELKEVWITLHHKIWKAKPIAPEPESL